MPTPRVSANVSDSTSPARAFTSVRRVSDAYASTDSSADAARMATRHRSSRSPTGGSGPADGHPGDAQGRAAVAHRNTLSVLSADALEPLEVVGHRVDGGQDADPVADQVRAPHRPGDLAVLDQVSLRDAEHEIARGRVDLATAQRLRVEPGGGVADHLAGFRRARDERRVRHA